jgi:hypothetical protein
LACLPVLPPSAGAPAGEPPAEPALAGPAEGTEG